jgi:translin
MDELGGIGDRILQHLEEKNSARDRALQLSRTLIRHCSTAIRAVHRGDFRAAREDINAARMIRDQLQADLSGFPDLYHAGYTQDALKEYAEANITAALVAGDGLPDPDLLGVEYAAYLGGLGEAAGELRRHTLDRLRAGDLQGAERLLAAMDDIYGLLVMVDFPDAITGNLRRITDMVRGVTERTRGDLTTAVREQQLKQALESVERKLGGQET